MGEMARGQVIDSYESCATVCHSQDMEATQMPISRRMDKEAVVHIHHGILLSH